MKNKLIDLNNHMFMQLERLNDEELSGDNLKQEIERSKAMANVARQVIDNASLALDAHKAMSELTPGKKAPAMLGLDDE